MFRLTKVFHFEMAHALHEYQGPCKNIHGHSYELYVTIISPDKRHDYIAGPGILVDFKEIKTIVKTNIIEILDHKLVLSRSFLAVHPTFSSQENLIVWEAEPSVENMLVYIRRTLSAKMPAGLNLGYLKLHETKDSYAEWLL